MSSEKQAINLMTKGKGRLLQVLNAHERQHYDKYIKFLDLEKQKCKRSLEKERRNYFSRLQHYYSKIYSRRPCDGIGSENDEVKTRMLIHSIGFECRRSEPMFSGKHVLPDDALQNGTKLSSPDRSSMQKEVSFVNQVSSHGLQKPCREPSFLKSIVRAESLKKVGKEVSFVDSVSQHVLSKTGKEPSFVKSVVRNGKTGKESSFVKSVVRNGKTGKEMSFVSSGSSQELSNHCKEPSFVKSVVPNGTSKQTGKGVSRCINSNSPNGLPKLYKEPSFVKYNFQDRSSIKNEHKSELSKSQSDLSPRKKRNSVKFVEKTNVHNSSINLNYKIPFYDSTIDVATMDNRPTTSATTHKRIKEVERAYETIGESNTLKQISLRTIPSCLRISSQLRRHRTLPDYFTKRRFDAIQEEQLEEGSTPTKHTNNELSDNEELKQNMRLPVLGKPKCIHTKENWVTSSATGDRPNKTGLIHRSSPRRALKEEINDDDSDYMYFDVDTSYSLPSLYNACANCEQEGSSSPPPPFNTPDSLSIECRKLQNCRNSSCF